MANALTISRTGGGSNLFRLQTTSFTVDHDRSPISAFLPGANPLLIDLGQWRVRITIEGTASLPGTNLTDSGDAIADKDDLEIMADSTDGNPWHTQTITLTDDTATANAGATTITYNVKISRVRLEKADAKDFYNFTIHLVGFMNSYT